MDVTGRAAGLGSVIHAMRCTTEVRFGFGCKSTPVSAPDNLPYGWEYQEETNCVVCGGCAFRYGAEHPDSDGQWTCPNCGDGNAKQAAELLKN